MKYLFTPRTHRWKTILFLFVVVSVTLYFAGKGSTYQVTISLAAFFWYYLGVADGREKES